ncbi:YHYH protein [Prosthecobacter fusiformis]|uniref:YHYH protein n=1 Tax=Prosthecobacter fusiformis TaxID=48464 RepID=A0A4R7RZ44_9BACT|nr:YHYH protein [Prosthecobacter fusiformis]TDU70659.1 YHYH protein [Prosthecobacter fusiformis]
MKRIWFLSSLLIPSLLAQNAQPEVTIREEGGKRVISSNGIPNHPTGDFPNEGNPNAIAPQKYEFRMTLRPKVGPQPTPSQRAFFGVAVNGVPFEPGTAEFWQRDPRSGWVAEAKSGQINLGLDGNEAHVQPNGAYHYHGLPTGLIAQLGGVESGKMLLLGWAADGFPIYASRSHQDPQDATSPVVSMRTSYRLKTGTRPGGNRGPGGEYDGYYTEDYEYVPGLGDLDECHGRFGVTPEYPEGIYHYCITDEFPYMGRLWKGEPDPSFEKQGGGPPGGGRGRRGGPGFGPPPGGGPPGMGPPGGRRPPGPGF